ncbi:MAG: ABC transporter permease [Nitrospinota bacterium]
MSAFLLPALTLWQREVVRFLRQRSRIAGALGQPLLFWLVIGSGFGSSFRAAGGGGGSGYAEYFFTGTLAMVVLFTAIFSTFSVMDDRKQRFLQGVLAAPVPRPAIVLGQALGGTTLGLLQGVLLLAAAPWAGVPLTAAGALASVAVMALMGFALTSLGLLFAWRIDSTQGLHSVMNLALLPLWLLSGAVFPAAGAHPALALLMRINPLTYGVAALRRTLYLGRPEALEGLPGLEASLLVMIVFALLAFLAAVRTAERSSG